MSDVIGRTRLPDRRPSVTEPVEFVQASGGSIRVLVTFSFAGDRVREIFSADFKAGSDVQTLIIDSCILVSRLLQHGTTPKMLLGSLSEPRSLLGTIIAAAAQVEEDRRNS